MSSLSVTALDRFIDGYGRLGDPQPGSGTRNIPEIIIFTRFCFLL